VFGSLAQAWDAAWPTGLAAIGMTVLATRKVLAWLHRRQIMDHPNERSSHTLPTPRGGGLATTPVLAVLFILLGWRFDGLEGIVLGIGALALMALSWWDDRHTLPVAPRFAAHAALIAVALALMPGEWLVFQGVLPLWVDRAVILLGWLWFLNLYNFMDGIDGITGIETLSLGAGLAVAGALIGDWSLLPYGAVTAGVAIGFLVFNWHPAKLFLGDSGSVPFGFILGGLLVLLAARGHLAAAVILPAYYLADATITLARRALAGEKVWQAHRKHFYQRATQGGKRHDQVAIAIAAGNAGLVACAVLTLLGHVWTGLAGGVVVTAGLLALLQSWSKGKPA
jgi:UDP-N-acetylmuramyl pentapeptide phosphotransferase/UDP-N-acetylglucosamine-1-phosphate transferase